MIDLIAAFCIQQHSQSFSGRELSGRSDALSRTSTGELSDAGAEFLPLKLDVDNNDFSVAAATVNRCNTSSLRERKLKLKRDGIKCDTLN
ncbi:hypothetical protein [Bradyrhizobium sp. CCBAU 11434]|uniref:hypothetical protein n=1 Tax=Bradyrhizobium sp. CCBAU 11434 TaxID=1630885 RepID=UPI00230664BC|nr:hypothetical protein [Bradyrhizobium sp. CCBAU 11434]